MISGLYHMTQLSLKSVLVPVFTARGTEVFRILEIPKVRARLPALDSISNRRNFSLLLISRRVLYPVTIFSSESSTVQRDMPYP